MVPVSNTGQIKTGGTGFPKPVVPVSASGAQIGAQRSEWKKEGLEKIEGDAVMLTRAQFARRRPEKGDRHVRRIFKRPRRWGSNFGRGTTQMSSGMGGGRGEAGVGGRNRRPAVGDGRSGSDGGSAR